MASMNKVLIIGNLVRDPEMRVTNTSQIPVTSFRIASTRRIRSKQSDSFRDETVFVDVETWGRLAEFCNQYLRKGRPVFIDGRLRLHEWTTQDGQRRSQIRIVAESVQDLGPRAPREQEQGGGYDEGGGRGGYAEDRGGQGGERAAYGESGGRGGKSYGGRARGNPAEAPAKPAGAEGEEPPPPVDNDYYGPTDGGGADPGDGPAPGGEDSVPF